jgi:hypothetical protein
LFALIVIAIFVLASILIKLLMSNSKLSEYLPFLGIYAKIDPFEGFLFDSEIRPKVSVKRVNLALGSVLIKLDLAVTIGLASRLFLPELGLAISVGLASGVTNYAIVEAIILGVFRSVRFVCSPNLEISPL